MELIGLDYEQLWTAVTVVIILVNIIAFLLTDRAALKKELREEREYSRFTVEENKELNALYRDLAEKTNGTVQRFETAITLLRESMK